MKLETGKTYNVSTLNCTGWTDGDGSSRDGYNFADYFDANGAYLGPDQHGIEPEFEGPTLEALNKTDDPVTFGGKMMSNDGHGNELWLFPELDKVANRFEDEEGGVFWTDDIEGWNYRQEDAID